MVPLFLYFYYGKEKSHLPSFLKHRNKLQASSRKGLAVAARKVMAETGTVLPDFRRPVNTRTQVWQFEGKKKHEHIVFKIGP